MKQHFSNFQFSLSAFIAGFCVFTMLLFGGITVKQNSVALGTISCHAITVSHPPEKAKETRKTNGLYKRLVKTLVRKDGAHKPIGEFIMLVFGLIVVLLGVWALSLFIAGSVVGAAVVGVLALVGLAFLIRGIISLND